MNVCIALFRGINVGGKNTLTMIELVGILEQLGCQHVKTYIQSGNAVFKINEPDITGFPDRLGAEIKGRRGFAAPVLLLRLAEFRKIVANNPFPEVPDDSKALHVGFLAAEPENPDLDTLENLKAESEQFQLIDRAFYLYAPDGVG